MAVEYHETDFSEYSTGAAPGDWSEEWGDTYGVLDIESNSGIGGKELQLDKSAVGHYGASWDDVGDVADVEILCRFKQTDSGDFTARFVLRGSNTGSAIDDGYMITVKNTSMPLIRWVNGVYATITTPTISYTYGNYAWVRFRVEGTSIKVRFWTGDFEDEPGTWDIDTTDSYVSAVGWAGPSAYNSDSDLRIDYFAVATDGGTARGPQQTNLFDGKVIVKDAATNSFDGKAVVKDVAAVLFDGKCIVATATDVTDYFDGKIVIKDAATNLFDGKTVIQNVAADLFDGLLVVSNAATGLFDGKIVIKDAATNLFDGKTVIQNVAADLFDGRLAIPVHVTNLLDGKVFLPLISSDELDGVLIVANFEQLFGNVVFMPKEIGASFAAKVLNIAFASKKPIITIE